MLSYGVMPGRRHRLKLRNKHGEIRPEVEDWDGMELDEWICGHIPFPPPFGTTCEDPSHPEDDTTSPINSYFWRIREGHVCYSYVCSPCSEKYDGEADPEEYPTTAGGYAQAPRHCRR